jgi:carbon starvation protein
MVGTVVSLALPATFVAMTVTNAKGQVVPAYTVVWPLFGSINQLLAGLTLVGLSLWLAKSRHGLWLRLAVGVPMVFMMGMTASALVLQIVNAPNLLLAGVAALLLALAVWVAVEAVVALWRKPAVVAGSTAA